MSIIARLISLLAVVSGCWLQIARADTPALLWEVSAKGTQLTLMGAVHLCKPDCFPLPAAAERRFQAAPALVVELDPSTAALSTELGANLLAPNASAAERLSPTEAARMRRAATQHGLPPELLGTMQPWMAGVTLYLLAAQQAGYSAEYGIDTWLIGRARAQHKPVIELETARRQLDALSAGSEDEQRRALLAILEALEQGELRTGLDQMVAAWKRGDASALEQLVREDPGFAAAASWREEIIDRRNREMTERLQQMLESGQSAFVVVGAAHLVGENGVPQLLARRGYQLRALQPGD